MKLKSPIPDIVKSLDKNSSYSFSKIKLIPYRGSSAMSSHGYLKFMYKLAGLSPSYNTCLRNVQRYAFRAITAFEKNGIEGFIFADEDTEQISKEDVIKLNDALKNVSLSIKDILKVGKEINYHKTICGNSYIHYQVRKIGNEQIITLKSYHPENVMIVDDDELFNTAVISNSFTEETLKNEKKYKKLPIFPAYNEDGGVKEFLFHFKNDSSESEVYGMSDHNAIIRNQFIEYALIQLSEKVSGKSEVASKLLAMRLDEFANDVNREAGDSGDIEMLMRKFANTLRKIITLDGDNPETIAVVGNPSGGDLQDIDLQINRDTDWYKENIEKHSSYIYASFSDHKQLTGMADARANLGGNVLATLYEKYNLNTIADVQSSIADDLMEVLNAIFDDLGLDEFKDIKPRFENRLEVIVNSLISKSDNSRRSITLLENEA